MNPSPGDIRNLSHDRSGLTYPGRTWQGEYLQTPYAGPRHGGELRLLWHCSYYDGPINGMCLYKGEKYWFDTVEEVSFEEWVEGDEDYPSAWEKTWSRRYAITTMSPENLTYEEMRHAKFRDLVGWHTDYTEDGKRAGGTHPQEQWQEFYDWSRNEPKKEYRGQVVAWFGFPGPQPYEVVGG